MSSELAPVALFAYNRPDHLRSALTSLAANPEARRTALTIFCDGPRSEEDERHVAQVRNVAHSSDVASLFAQVEVKEREANAGLSTSIIEGVSRLLDRHSSVIVVEDDLVVSSSFLGFMNAALREYRDADEVVSIHGFTMNTEQKLPETFFIRGADCWGWATWDRGWRVFDPDGRALLQRLDASGELDEFDFWGTFPYRRMLIDQIEGRVDSWAIRWYASAFLDRKLTLYPGQSLVRNIGQEGSGTHSTLVGSHDVTESDFSLPLTRVDVHESLEARRAFAQAMAGDRGSSWVSRLLRRGRRQ